MSIKVMTWAWEQELPPLTKLVLMAIADHCDDEGYAWPGIKGIAKKCGVAHSTVQRHVQSLEEQGILNVKPRQRPDGSSSSNGYTVIMDGTIRDQGVSESDPPMSASDPRVSEELPLGIRPDTPLTVIEPSCETTTTEPLTLLEVFDDPEWLQELMNTVTPDINQRNNIIKWARNHEEGVLTDTAHSLAQMWEIYKNKNKSIYATFMNWVRMEEARREERGKPAPVLPRSQKDRYGAEAYIQKQGIHPNSEEANQIRREWSNGS